MCMDRGFACPVCSMLEWLQKRFGCSMFCCFRMMKCTWIFSHWLNYSRGYVWPTCYGGTSDRTSCMTHRGHHSHLSSVKKMLQTDVPSTACHARQIKFTSVFFFFSFFLSLCLLCSVLSRPVLPLPLPPTLLSLQSLWTLALQWVCRVPGHAPENNLLLPHLPHQHPRLHQHLPHGPFPHRGRRWHPDCYHRWQWGWFLPDGAGAHRRRDVGSEAHQQAPGLWAVFGAKTASLRHAQHISG